MMKERRRGGKQPDGEAYESMMKQFSVVRLQEEALTGCVPGTADGFSCLMANERGRNTSCGCCLSKTKT